MQISFHGAARTVTGSKHLLELEDGRKVLLDCGMFQGHGADTDPLNRHLGFDPQELSFVILSHAHIDHSGLLPLLAKEGYEGPIYCTPATRDLCVIMLADTAHIQENDAVYINRKRKHNGLPGLKPIYRMEHVEAVMKQFCTVPYDKPFRIDDGIELRFTDSGHILGSAAINLVIQEKGKPVRICFTGDIGRPDDLLLRAPSPIPQPDILICESTYGNRLHEDREISHKRLLEIVLDTCVQRGGKLVIPAFSLGRTQELVYALNNLHNAGQLPPIPVYVDSPLSVNATVIMRTHMECFNDDLRKMLQNDPDPFGFDQLHYVQRAEDSIRLNEQKEPMIILSASGMAEAGRIKHHIRNTIESPQNTILLVGYCTPDSLGGRLAAGAKEVRIFGKLFSVNAHVEQLNAYSAHADYREMLQYLSGVDSKQVRQTFLVHGEYDVQHEWRQKLEAVGFGNIEIPDMHSSWEIRA
jgi:metallo-beta-lactamase family protein